MKNNIPLPPIEFDDAELQRIWDTQPLDFRAWALAMIDRQIPFTDKDGNEQPPAHWGKWAAWMESSK